MPENSLVVSIVKDRTPGAAITVPRSFLAKRDKYNIQRVKVGQLNKEVICFSNSTENVMEIDPSLAEELGLTDSMPINVRVDGGKLCLGPVVSVFTGTGTIRKANLQEPHFRLAELSDANQEAGTILYFFSVGDVDFVKFKILGTYYNSVTHNWEKKSFPFPDVLYDRGGGITPEQTVISTFIRQQLEGLPDLQKINATYYFDKWDVYQKLRKFKDMQRYLPVTKLYRGKADLVDMFAKTSSVYLKDCIGNNGRGVARAVKTKSGYELSYFAEKVVNLKLATFDNLIQQIESLFRNKTIILQEAIDVIEIGHRHVDMRATVQRDGRGQLGVTAYPARLGQKKCPITSTRSGSTVYRFEDFFARHFQYGEEQIEELLAKINVMLFKSFHYIEQVYGSFGELGIDFALDKKGEVWFIECNAKPGKDALCMSYNRQTIRKAFLNPLEYAKNLAGF